MVWYSIANGRERRREQNTAQNDWCYDPEVLGLEWVAACSLGFGSSSPSWAGLCPTFPLPRGGTGMSRGSSEGLGAAVSRAVLGQGTPGTQWAPSALLRGNHLAKSECNFTRTAKRPLLTPEPATSHISTSFFKLWERAGIFKEAIQAEKVGENLIRTDKTI